MMLDGLIFALIVLFGGGFSLWIIRGSLKGLNALAKLEFDFQYEMHRHRLYSK